MVIYSNCIFDFNLLLAIDKKSFTLSRYIIVINILVFIFQFFSFLLFLFDNSKKTLYYQWQISVCWRNDTGFTQFFQEFLNIYISIVNRFFCVFFAVEIEIEFIFFVDRLDLFLGFCILLYICQICGMFVLLHSFFVVWLLLNCFLLY